jgi:hypothetical protein
MQEICDLSHNKKVKARNRKDKPKCDKQFSRLCGKGSCTCKGKEKLRKTIQRLLSKETNFLEREKNSSFGFSLQAGVLLFVNFHIYCSLLKYDCNWEMIDLPHLPVSSFAIKMTIASKRDSNIWWHCVVFLFVGFFFFFFSLKSFGRSKNRINLF